MLELATTLDPIKGVGSFVATDRVFSLLEREFDTSDVHAAVAAALKPQGEADLSAHELVLDLAGRRSGTIRLVTTNFDRLFEDCDPEVRSIGPAHLPDPKRAELNAVIHLHGRVDPEYLGSDDEGFVLSSGDFGRAYLAEGWATRFIQSLLSRFSIVFLGYSADDPPVQYLLEALKAASEAHGRMYAFQSGESAVASSLWENKGVHAMAYDPSNRHEALWSTLDAWAKRANNIDGWYDAVIEKAARGPETLHPHERGQVAHILSFAEGVRRFISLTDNGVPASWLKVIDPRERYGQRERAVDQARGSFDPFDFYGLDSDAPPPPPDVREDEFSYIRRPREVPQHSWDGFDLLPTDSSTTERRSGLFHGVSAATADRLPSRLDLLAVWFRSVAHQTDAFSWALKQPDVHPRVKSLVSSAVKNGGDKFPTDIDQGWRYLLRMWDDRRDAPDQVAFAVSAEAKVMGWSDEMVRRLIETRRPRLQVEAPFRSRSSEEDRAFSLKVEYPRPQIEVEIPRGMLVSAIARLRENLDYARSLEIEVHGRDWIYLPTTYETAGQLLDLDGHGPLGLVLEMQRMMGSLAAIDPSAAHAEFLRWPIDDDGIFTRLRIWAARQKSITSIEEAAAILVGLRDKLFWGDLHQRDLMMTLGVRWNDFPRALRLKLENKLISTNYPWGSFDKSAEYNDQALLERLRWLAAQSLRLSHNIKRLISDLTDRLEGEMPDINNAVEDTQPKVFELGTNNDPAELSSLTIPEILPAAAAVGGIDYRTKMQRDPFAGLVELRPVKALSALWYEARNGRIHIERWGSFLRSEKRAHDSTRLLRLICARLATMAAANLSQLLYPAAEWMSRLAPRLMIELPDVFEALWQKTVEASAAFPAGDSERYSERNWAEDGLNRPVGKLTQVLFQDPSLSGRRRNSGLAADWKLKMETLLSLPGDLRRQALVIASFQFVFFWLIDPKWAETTVMPSMESGGPDEDAFWDGFLWANKVPPLPLFLKMRASIARKIAEGSRRKPIRDSLADITLYAWIEWSDRKRRPFTNAEFRELIVEGGPQFGMRVLWNLGRRLQKRTVSREKVVLFFREVWPLQKTFKSEEISRALSTFLFKTGDLFAEVAKLIVGRLIPCENFDDYAIYTEEPGGIIDTYPETLLEVLLRLLPNDVNRWPHHAGEILDRLALAPSGSADARLKQLRRAMGRPAIVAAV